MHAGALRRLFDTLLTRCSPEQGSPNDGRKNRRGEHDDLGGREVRGAWKRLPGDKERHREADASEGSRPGQLPPRVLCRLDGYARAHGRSSREEDSERLSYGEASDDRGHEPAMPNKDARIDRHARIRKCEDREDSVARPRAGVPQQPVGWRFKSVVDCVERVQRRGGGAVPENLTLVPGLGGDDGAGLRY